MIKYSIIIPVYNRPKLLIKTLDSIDGLMDSEVIVVDDHSSEENAVMQKKETELRGFKYIYKKNNEGLSEARNTGFENSLGRYIYFLDSDDLLTKKFVKYLNKNFPKISKEPIWRTWYKIVGKRGKVKTTTLGNKITKRDKYYSSSASTYLLSRDILIETRFVSRFLEDVIFTANIFSKICYKDIKILKIYSFLYRKNHNGGSILSNDIKFSQVSDFFKYSKRISNNNERIFAEARILWYLNKNNHDIIHSFENELIRLKRNRDILIKNSPIYFKFAFRRLLKISV